MPIKRKWNKDMHCHACKSKIENGEYYESTKNPFRAYCDKCSNKEILVFQP